MIHLGSLVIVLTTIGLLLLLDRRHRGTHRTSERSFTFVPVDYAASVVLRNRATRSRRQDYSVDVPIMMADTSESDAYYDTTTFLHYRPHRIQARRATTTTVDSSSPQLVLPHPPSSTSTTSTHSSPPPPVQPSVQPSLPSPPSSPLFPSFPSPIFLPSPPTQPSPLFSPSLCPPSPLLLSLPYHPLSLSALLPVLPPTRASDSESPMMTSPSSFVSEGSVTAAVGVVGDDVDERDGGHQDIDLENADIWSYVHMS
jgi:hypothetical protein